MRRIISLRQAKRIEILKMFAEKKTSWLNKLMWVLSIFAMLGLCFSVLAAYVSPSKIWWLALFGLGFTPLFLLNLFFLIYWALQRRRRTQIVLAVIILSLIRLPSMYRFGSSAEIESTTPKSDTLKVMSFNVLLFNLYNWFHNTETRNMIFRKDKQWETSYGEQMLDIGAYLNYFLSSKAD